MLSHLFGKRNSQRLSAPSVDIGSYFVGRENLTTAFANYCDPQREERLRVFVVHGAPGMGKTTLLRQFREVLGELAPNVKHATVDFAALRDTTQAWREALIALREDLGLAGALFPTFDLLLGFSLAGEGGDPLLEPLLCPQLSEAYQFASAALSAYSSDVATLPYFLREALSRAPEMFPALDLSHLQENEHEGRKAIAGMCRRALRQDPGLPFEIVQAFADDLQSSLPPASTVFPTVYNVSDFALRGVLFFDSYEHLWDDRHVGSSSNERQLDWWVRELAANCFAFGILPVVLGREPLMWAEDDVDWTHDDLDQHVLSGLSFQEASQFLVRCSIGTPPPVKKTDSQDNSGPDIEKLGWADPLLPSHMSEEDRAFVQHDPLQAAIIHCCAGMELADRAVFSRSAAGTFDETQYASDPDCHPFWLAVCASIVLNGRAANKRDPAPAQFARITPDQAAKRLTELFLRSLSDRYLERGLLELSITPRFDQDVAQSQAGELLRDDAPLEWAAIRSLFFMQVEPPRGQQQAEFLRIHPLLRRELQARLKIEEALEEHLNLAHYWGERGDAALEWYHLWHIESRDALARWRHRHRAALDSGDWRGARSLIALWREVPLDEEDHQRIGDPLWGRAHEAIARSLLDTPFTSPTTAYALAADHLQNAHQGYIHSDYGILRAQAGQLLQLARNRLLLVDAEIALGLNNPKRARDAFLGALAFFNKDQHPDEWLRVQLGLGYAHRDLPENEDQGARPLFGASENNTTRAIAHFEQASRLLAPDKDLETWGRVQRELGLLYRRTTASARMENLRRAIIHLVNSLQYFTEAEHFEEWANTQRILGDCYMEFRLEERPLVLRYAAGCFEGALRFYDESVYLEERAQLYYDIGLAWGEFGDVANDLDAFVTARDAFSEAARLFRSLNWAEEERKAEALVEEINAALERFCNAATADSSEPAPEEQEPLPKPPVVVPDPPKVAPAQPKTDPDQQEFDALFDEFEAQNN